MAEFKKYLMKHVWRIQQIGALGSVIMISMTIALILYPMVQWRFVELGIPGEWDWLIILILWFMVMGTVMIGGFAYDKLLRMWIPQQRVAVERNPYAKNLMTPKEVINWLKANSINIISALPSAKLSLWETKFNFPCAIVLGAEDKGLTDNFKTSSHIRVRIPMKGAIDSLNVSASAAIIIYEALRQQ